MNRHSNDASTPDLSRDLLPNGLEAFTLGVESGEFVIFSVPLPELELPAVLTGAERGVVIGVLEGKRNHEIARDRGTSVNTVVNQLATAYRKLGVSSRWELISRVNQLNGFAGTNGETP